MSSSEISSAVPELNGGSCEVARVRATFERLHLLVKAANSAFFLGELTKAYANLRDALALFTALENAKAIGIANNNLGNVMLALFRVMTKTDVPTISGWNRYKIVQKGLQYFQASIDAGEAALKEIHDLEGWSENYLVFMQQLSNRYFNRAIFLLTVRDDHPEPAQAEVQGFSDLATCQSMDREVVDNGDREGFKGDIDVKFELLMGRMRGLLLLMKAGYDDTWGIEDLLEEAHALLFSALLADDACMFRDLAAPGQMQRWDSVCVEYLLLMAKTDTENRKEWTEQAASVAIRMLADDEYIIGEAGLLAISALIEYCSLSQEAIGGDDPSDVRSTLFSYRHAVKEKIALFYTGNDLLSRESFLAVNAGDFSMETF